MSVIVKEFKRKPQPPEVDVISAVRSIDCVLKVGDTEIPQVQMWRTNEVTYSAGTTMEVTCPASLDYDLMKKSQEIVKQGKPLPVVLTTVMSINGQPGKGGEEFNGILDVIKLNLKTRMYTLNCVSYARVLVNEKISETVAGTSNAGKTTAQVVEDMVKKYGKGLKSKVHPFKTKVGQVYKDKMVKTIKNMAVWDLLESFANQDNADLYVKGDTLYYVPKPTDVAPDVTELKGVKPDLTFTHAQLLDGDVTHSALYAHDITVTVKSYQPKTGQTYESKANLSTAQINAVAKKLEQNPSTYAKVNALSVSKMKRKKGQDSVSSTYKPARIGKKENYVFNLPNVTQEDCDRIALKIAEDISQKEFAINITVPAYPQYNTRQYVALKDMPSAALNQVYAIKSIEKSMGVPDQDGSAQGYIANLSIVNHTVQSAGVTFGS